MYYNYLSFLSSICMVAPDRIWNNMFKYIW